MKNAWWELRYRIPLWGIVVLSFTGILRSQQNPVREFRGVWLTTLQGLDWPSQASRGNPEKQKSELIAILDDLQRMNLNVVIFQARSRGNAFYRSSHEPWAAELTGSLGKDPGWDPLQFAIEECRKRGLEIHAWVNMVKAWSGDGKPPSTTPLHVMYAHPTWVRLYRNEYWLDPGIPEAREYLVRIAEDIATKYDLDGIHLDYIRYPDADFDDAETFRRFGSGKSKADWRRENINGIVRDVYERVKQINAAIQIGSAPIGIFENLPTARGWQGLHAISQDSRRWLREGYHDYVCPQVYWSLRSRGGKIDFEALARDWKSGASGKHVAVGIAPYKDDVKPWLHEHIDATRTQGADGQVFFRYEHIKGESFRQRYAAKAIPPPLHWRDNVRPNPPRYLTVQRDGNASILSWQHAVPAIDGDRAFRYVVYRNARERNAGEAAQIVAVLPATETTYRDEAGSESSSYAVRALDRFRNESDAVTTSTKPLPAPSLVSATPQVSEAIPALDDLRLIAFTLPEAAHVRLRLMDSRGAEVFILVDEPKPSGTFVIGIEKTNLPDDIARFVFEAGTYRLVREF